MTAVLSVFPGDVHLLLLAVVFGDAIFCLL